MTRKIAIQSLNKKISSEDLKLKIMTEFMSQNKSYILNKNKTGDENKFLQDLKSNYLNYRKNWTLQPKEIIKNKLTNIDIEKNKIIPLCVDIEVAAVCDLACPHCYRQFIATPDKIISEKLCKNLIDQASDMGVPSIKFNWRGEPLLHPKLSEFILYAKQKGILETIINTNATMLSEKMCEKLIESGLDILIFSFDGGSAKTYEKLRPGRFKENSFNNVYENIKNFKKARDKAKSQLPLTKVQMVLTEDTFQEQDEFFKLFDDYVDDVSVKQYTERGGELDTLKIDLINKNKISKDKQNNELLRDPDGNLFISKGRLPCEQPYQRMLVTYDGRVSMCCYDWGSMHPIGYVDQLAIDIGDKDYKKIKDQIAIKKKGFELMKPVMPKNFNFPKKEVLSLQQVWTGYEMDKVRSKHMNDKLEEVEICKKCPFKETYEWELIKN